MRLPDPCLVVLVGASGAGKSAWAARWFAAGEIVSSDRLRAVVGTGERDQRASADAFELLDLVVAKRCKRGLTTVIDTTGLDPKRRAAWLAIAAKHRIPAYAVVFDPPPAVVRERNRERGSPVPSKVVSAQLRSVAAVGVALATEDFAAVARSDDEPVTLVPPAFLTAPAAAARQRDDPVELDFGLQISRWEFPGHPAATAQTLATMAQAAEQAGFTSLWVMDHFLQIPQVGREWEDMPESYTTLGYLAGVTSTIRLGALVTGLVYRNLAHLGKIVATLDVLSGGRAMCGIGAGWFAREHELYGWGELPSIRERLDRVEDALQLLPLLWGPGAPRFEGKTITVEEAVCYPRPLQTHVPILVGGSGERRTLKLVARHADLCNLFGEPDSVRRKLAVLHEHCAAAGRDPAEITVTQLGAATVQEHIGRYRELAEAGVQTAIVGLADSAGPESVRRFAAVIAAFR